MDWNTIANLAREAFRVAVNEWIGKARIQGGTVNGPSAVLTPGSLVSETNLETRILQILTNARVPREISAAFAKVLATAWNDWARSFQIQLPKAYPTFAAFPGPVAPPTRATVEPSLSQGSSVGEVSLKSSHLTNQLSSALQLHTTSRTPIHPAQATGSPDEAIKGLAAWIEDSFNGWKKMVKLVGVMGKGSVVTFAPPYVPVGPVVMGENMTTGSPFAGPRFGKIVL